MKAEVVGRLCCSEKGYTFNRSAAAARARGMRPSMEDRRRRLDFSALQVHCTP